MNVPRTGVVALAVSSLLVSGCGDQAEVPVITGIGQELDISWEPAQPLVGVRDQIVDGLESRGVSTLLPTSTPDDASETKGRFTILTTVPTGIVTAQVVTEGPDWLLSLTSSAASTETDDCEARIGSELESGVAWERINVRSVPGCAAENEAGLIFLEWDEAGHRFHVEGSMQLDEAIAWLDLGGRAIVDNRRAPSSSASAQEVPSSAA